MIALAGCDFGHLGNPLSLPVRAVAAGVENASYDARRSRVSGYLAANKILLNASSASSPVWAGLFDLAGIAPSMQAKAAHEVKEQPGHPEWLERATVIAMVHGR